MHIAVVGAGAIGCYLGARLSERGHRITLVGRPEQVDAIGRAGLRLREPDGTVRTYRPACVPTLIERPDLVLLTVKSQDVVEAARALQPVIAGVPLVAMQNGVQGDRLAASVLGEQDLLGAVIMCAATYLRPGEVSVEFPGWLIAGDRFRQADRHLPRVLTVLDGVLPTYRTAYLERVRWSKLIANLNNALSAATGLLLVEIMKQAPGRPLPARVMREGLRVVQAAGIRLDHGLYGLTPRAMRRAPNAALIALLQASMTTVLGRVPERAAEGILVAAGRSRLNRLPIKGSTWQSIARGRRSEIDYLNGEIVRLGERLGIATPFNSRLVELVHAVEDSGRFFPVMDLWPAGLNADERSAAGGRA